MQLGASCSSRSHCQVIQALLRSDVEATLKTIDGKIRVVVWSLCAFRLRRQRGGGCAPGRCMTFNVHPRFFFFSPPASAMPMEGWISHIVLLLVEYMYRSSFLVSYNLYQIFIVTFFVLADPSPEDEIYNDVLRCNLNLFLI